MKDHKEDAKLDAMAEAKRSAEANLKTGTMMRPEREKHRPSFNNVCNRPGLGASKIDLQDLHDEKMRNKRLRYHAKNKHGRPTFQTHRHRPTSGNVGHQNWPDGKFAGAHNNCATSVKYRKGA